MYYKTLPDITEKQEEIMEFVWKFRFINRHQIQKLFNYKSPRRLNEWLKDLVNKGYLGRIYSHKLLENTKPSIYYLMNNGIIHHYRRQFDWDEAEAKDMKKFYEDKHASKTFITHCINVCNLYLELWDLKNEEKEGEYELSTKNEMWTTDLASRRRSRNEDEERDYIPDLQVGKYEEEEDGDFDCSTFNIELFDYYIPWYALQGKVDKYITLASDNKNHGHFSNEESEPLTIMIILPNIRKVSRLKTYIEDQIVYERDLKYVYFRLTTFDKVLEKGITDETIWKIVSGFSVDEEEDESQEDEE